MNLYWSLKQVPELSGLSTAERLRVHQACYRRHVFKSKRCLAALALCGLCSGAGVALGVLLPRLWGGSFSLWHLVLGAGFGGGVGGFIFGHVVTSYLRPFYADFIRNELQPDPPQSTPH